MVKMYKLNCVQDLDFREGVLFKCGKTYIGRTSRNGKIMIKDDFNQWHILDDRSMHPFNYIRDNFNIEKEFFVTTHKEAMRY